MKAIRLDRRTARDFGVYTKLLASSNNHEEEAMKDGTNDATAAAGATTRTTTSRGNGLTKRLESQQSTCQRSCARSVLVLLIVCIAAAASALNGSSVGNSISLRLQLLANRTGHESNETFIPPHAAAALERVQRSDDMTSSSDQQHPQQVQRPMATSNVTQYHYLHIPKTGGYTIEKLLRMGGVSVQQLGLGRRFHLDQWENWTRTHPDFQLFMIESGYSQYQPKHSLTMFREPMSHVLSQFFHCTESAEHHRLQRNEAMPDTLLEWLQAWNDIRQQHPEMERNTSNSLSRWRDARFKCFVPLNFQSWLTLFPTTKEDLRSRFDAVGIMEDMEKSFCLFLVQIEKRVPGICDCTDGRPSIQLPKRSADHGVLHHGSTYHPTDEERALIEQITALDRPLYQQASVLFQELVANVENHYQVKLCGKEQ
ncbi:hypothetical protein ACA910_010167 [Epithemia clementina (nom. ined.)]